MPISKIDPAAVLSIITIILKLEPIGLQLALDLMSKLDGKSDVEILTDENLKLDAIIAKARAEQAKP